MEGLLTHSPPSRQPRPLPKLMRLLGLQGRFLHQFRPAEPPAAAAPEIDAAIGPPGALSSINFADDPAYESATGRLARPLRVNRGFQGGSSSRGVQFPNRSSSASSTTWPSSRARAAPRQ